MICVHFDSNFTDAIKHQAITWTNIDQGLEHHMVSLDRNELKQIQ